MGERGIAGGDKLAIAVAKANGARVLRLSGEFDLAGVETFERHVRAGGDAKTTILDLGELRFIDSSGLRALIRAEASLREAGERVVVVKSGGRVAELLEMTGVAERLELTDEMPSELRANDAD